MYFCAQRYPTYTTAKVSLRQGRKKLQQGSNNSIWESCYRLQKEEFHSLMCISLLPLFLDLLLLTILILFKTFAQKLRERNHSLLGRLVLVRNSHTDSIRISKRIQPDHDSVEIVLINLVIIVNSVGFLISFSVEFFKRYFSSLIGGLFLVLCSLLLLLSLA